MLTGQQNSVALGVKPIELKTQVWISIQWNFAESEILSLGWEGITFPFNEPRKYFFIELMKDIDQIYNFLFVQWL